MQNVNTLLQFLFNVGIGNREKAESALHTDFVVNEVESFPYGGTYRGAKGWWKLGAIVTSYWIFDEIELQQAIQSSEGDTVCLIVGIKAVAVLTAVISIREFARYGPSAMALLHRLVPSSGILRQ